MKLNLDKYYLVLSGSDVITINTGNASIIKAALSGLKPLKALCKWWKMLFISFWKIFLFPRYLNVCLEFSVIYKYDLIKKTGVISKFMTSQPG